MDIVKKPLLIALLIVGLVFPNELPSKISDNTWSISAGLGTNENTTTYTYSFSLLAYTWKYRKSCLENVDEQEKPLDGNS